MEKSLWVANGVAKVKKILYSIAVLCFIGLSVKFVTFILKDGIGVQLSTNQIISNNKIISEKNKQQWIAEAVKLNPEVSQQNFDKIYEDIHSLNDFYENEIILPDNTVQKNKTFSEKLGDLFIFVLYLIGMVFLIVIIWNFFQTEIFKKILAKFNKLSGIQRICTVLSFSWLNVIFAYTMLNEMYLLPNIGVVFLSVEAIGFPIVTIWGCYWVYLGFKDNRQPANG